MADEPFMRSTIDPMIRDMLERDDVPDMVALLKFWREIRRLYRGWKRSNWN